MVICNMQLLPINGLEKKKVLWFYVSSYIFSAFQFCQNFQNLIWTKSVQARPTIKQNQVSSYSQGSFFNKLFSKMIKIWYQLSSWLRGYNLCTYQLFSFSSHRWLEFILSSSSVTKITFLWQIFGLKSIFSRIKKVSYVTSWISFITSQYFIEYKFWSTDRKSSSN